MTAPYSAGDKSRAFCADCVAVVGTTMGHHDVPFQDDPTNFVRGILAATCDDCAAIVAIPAQSTPQIKKERNNPI